MTEGLQDIKNMLAMEDEHLRVVVHKRHLESFGIKTREGKELRMMWTVTGQRSAKPKALPRRPSKYMKELLRSEQRRWM